MKRSLFCAFYLFLSMFLFGDDLIPSNLFSIDVITKQFKNSEYLELPYSIYKTGRIPKDSLYILYLSNSQKYGKIFSQNGNGQCIVLLNYYDKQVFLRKPIASYPGPMYLVFNQKPKILDEESTVSCIVLGRYIGTIYDRPVFSFVEGFFERNISEYLNELSSNYSLDSFPDLENLEYVDSMY